MKQPLLLSFFLLLYTLVPVPAHATDAIWVLVDTEKLQLKVKRGNKTLATMKNIAIGQNGAGTKTHKGDDMTPLGSYKIGWINNKSRFNKFYGFNYPSIKNAETALLSGLLTEKEYHSNLKAHKNKKVPSQNTTIGGYIGIHGLGAANKDIHKLLNWTHGCIALTNEQIELLSQWVGKGTVVKVK